MTIKVYVVEYDSGGGWVGIDDDGGFVIIVECRTPMIKNALRRLGAKKLRAMADRLEADINKP